MGKFFYQIIIGLYITFVCLLVSPPLVAASSYGDGSYGIGNYNEGETSSSQTVSNSVTSSSSSNTCSDAAPGSRGSWLYGAIPKNSTSIQLYFTEAGEPVTKYVLEYGTKSGEYQFGVSDMGMNERNQMMFEVNSLSPNTTYYFRIRSDNGCATGPLSNEISATTKKSFAFRELAFTESNVDFKAKPNDPGDFLEEESQDTLEDENSEEQTGFDVNIKVVDKSNNPVGGANVTLHSEPKEAVTDENGIASFTNVEQGEHSVLIAYENYKGEQSIYLQSDGTTKTFDINITIEPKNVLLSPQVLIVIGVLSIVILALIIIIIRSKRNK